MFKTRLPCLVLCTLLLASAAFASASRHACSAVNIPDDISINWKLVMDLDSAQAVELGNLGGKQTDTEKNIWLSRVEGGSTWNYQYYSSLDTTAIVAIFAHLDYINTELDCGSQLDCIDFVTVPNNSIAIIRSRPMDSSSARADTASLGQVMEYELYRLQKEGLLKADSAWIGQALQALRASAGGDDIGSIFYHLNRVFDLRGGLDNEKNCSGALLYLGHPSFTPILAVSTAQAFRLEALPDGSYALPVGLREGSFTLRNASGRAIPYSLPTPWRIRPSTHPAYLEARNPARSWLLP